MANLGNKKKLAAICRDNHEDHPRNNQAGDINSPRIQGDYNTQVSEEIEVIVTKKLSHEEGKSHFGRLIATR